MNWQIGDGPASWLALAVVVVVETNVMGYSQDKESVLSNLLALQNYLTQCSCRLR